MQYFLDSICKFPSEWMTQPLWLSFTIQHIHRKTGSLNMENTFGFYSSSVHGCPLSYSSTLSIPLTPKPNSPQTPANAACKATDLFWFCRIRRQQKGEDSDREAKKLRDGARERGIHSATAPFSHCTDASHLFSSELMHSYQGQNDVVNKRQGGGGGGGGGGGVKSTRTGSAYTPRFQSKKDWKQLKS